MDNPEKPADEVKQNKYITQHVLDTTNNHK